MRPENCTGCGSNLTSVPTTSVIRRQEVDLAEQKPLYVKEYRSEVLVRPSCGKQNAGTFPRHLKACVQYGAKLGGILMLWVHKHGIPYKRATELVREMYNVCISSGTIVNMTKRLANEAVKAVKDIKDQLKREPVAHLNETGLRTAGKTMWVHTMISSQNTHLFISEHRGGEAIKEHLEGYEGTAIHDGWKSYQKFECTHGLCNAHHLRELTFLYEVQHLDWDKAFSDLLLSAYRQTLEGPLSVEDQTKIREQAQAILDQAKVQHPPPEPPLPGHRGRVRKSKARN